MIFILIYHLKLILTERCFTKKAGRLAFPVTFPYLKATVSQKTHICGWLVGAAHSWLGLQEVLE